MGDDVDITTWWDCYNNQWGDELVPEAFSHPAKGAPGLSKRIYDHAVDEGWLSAGDMVLDPFGGIAGFGLQAMAHGLVWVGVELEQKFVDLGNQNIALWNRRYNRFANWGSAVLLQGDSRNLLAVVEAGRVAGVVSSPPFGGSKLSTDENPRANMANPGRNWFTGAYGDGNLGNLRATETGFDALIASPPYSETHITDIYTGRIGDNPDVKIWHQTQWDNYNRKSPGQLGAMPAGDFDAAVSSPPFEGVGVGGRNNVVGANTQCVSRNRPENIGRGQNARGLEYGEADGQIGASSGDDFWSAARIIVQQTYAALRPGGHALWVVKAFVRDKQIVDFPGHWRSLCETCGFVSLHEHHAMLVSEVSQIGFDGKHKRRERKSFFRRLAESKGSPRIDFEVVLCMEKP